MRYEEFFLNFAVIMQQKDNSHKSWAQGKLPKNWGFYPKVIRLRPNLSKRNLSPFLVPRRLLLKRQHPEFFSPLGTITLAGTNFQAMGDLALLSCKKKLALQCSRHLYQQEIDHLQLTFLAEGKQGTTIISPCISRGEQQIATACIEAHIPFIVLLVGGFPPYYKPTPLYLQACAEGRLLLLSPFQWQNEKITNMRQRCLYLNELAKRICEEANKKG